MFHYYSGDLVQERMSADLEQQLRESETLVEYLRSTIDDKDERLARVEHELANFKTEQQKMIKDITDDFNSKVSVLRNELEATQIELKDQEELNDSLALSRKENIILRAELDHQRQECLNVRKQSKEDIQKTRDEVMQIRAGLTAEFQIQLDNAICGEVKQSLSKLPEKARIALGEKEILLLQQQQNDEKAYQIVQENNDLRKQCQELQLDISILKEENALLGKRAGMLNSQKELIEKENDQLRELSEERIGQQQIYMIEQRQIDELTEKAAEFEKQSYQNEKRLALALSGLRKLCSREKLKLSAYYLDPFEAAGTKSEPESIIMQKERFISPEI